MVVQWFAELPGPVQLLVGALVVLFALVAVWALLTLVFMPILAVLQKLMSPVENSTSISDRDYLLGTLTLAVSAQHTGEVMVTGGGKARQTYPAKLWQPEDAAIPQGSRVVIVSQRAGIAYVQRLQDADNHK